MKARVYVIMLLAISATMLVLSANSSVVSAQPCTATLSYPVIPAQYSNTNVPFVVPISASCTTFYGNQLYATANAYDATTNTGLGSASTALSSVNGGTEFNGQLGFSLLPTSPSDSVQISASIYSSEGGTLITATSETVQLGAGVQQTVQPIEPVQQITTTTTVTQGQYPYANPSPIAYPSPYEPNQSQYYQTQPQYQGHHSHSTYFWQGFAQRSNNTNLFDYAVIIAIITAVIIATVGLVLIARKQQPQPVPVWYPTPPPPPR